MNTTKNTTKSVQAGVADWPLICEKNVPIICVQVVLTWQTA